MWTTIYEIPESNVTTLKWQVYISTVDFFCVKINDYRYQWIFK